MDTRSLVWRVYQFRHPRLDPLDGEELREGKSIGKMFSKNSRFCIVFFHLVIKKAEHHGCSAQFEMQKLQKLWLRNPH